MARYPGSQFILIDNTAESSNVSVSGLNPNAPTYAVTFNSVKGPEEIRNNVYGQSFYDLYGSQANINFSKYGQPLLQASMNINNGAKLICKRAVLEDATLANATLAVVVTKCPQADPVIELDENGNIKTITLADISSATDEVPSKFTLRPVMVSIKDNTPVPDIDFERKNLYSIHKSNIITSILEDSDESGVHIASAVVFKGQGEATAALIDSNNSTIVDKNGLVVTVGTAGDTVEKTFALPVTSIKNGFSSYNEWSYTDMEELPSGIVTSDNKKYTVETPSEDMNTTILEYAYKTRYIEYVYPLVTFFDNGRGVSTKSIAIVFDTETSKSIGKAAYLLKVYDYSTNKPLESFSFTVDPYIKNANGYAFDIETAVNLKSNQITTKMHYDSYEKLVDELVKNAYVDSQIFVTRDCLFCHTLKGAVIDQNTMQQEGLFIDATSSLNNLTSKTDDTIYYYYNYSTRYKRGISEKLPFGTEGTTDNITTGEDTITPATENTINPLVVIKEGGSAVGLDYATQTSIIENATATTKLYNQIPYIQVIIDPTAKTSAKKVAKISYDSKGNKTITQKYAYIDKKNKDSKPVYTLLSEQPADWSTAYTSYYTLSDGKYVAVTGNSAPSFTTNTYYKYTEGTYVYSIITVNTFVPKDAAYQLEYKKFFNGQFDKDIFNVDVYFPTAVFDCNYSNDVKFAIQKLAAFRGDFLAYMDMGVNKINSYTTAMSMIPPEDEAESLSEDNGYAYIRDMHNAVTCLSYDIKDPYSNKQISVTGTYGLSNAMINHYINGVGRPFAGKGYGITFPNAIDTTINYIPKIYPTSAMTSLSNIGNTYISDDDSIVNEKQIMNDARINYGSYYDGVLTMDTEYTLVNTNSDFAFINNVMLVNDVIQEIRKVCPSARYNFLDEDGLKVYKEAVNKVLDKKRSSFKSISFEYVSNDNSAVNKTFYAALKVQFSEFAQAEIFTITAFNSSVDLATVTA